MSWTDDRVRILKLLWLEGLTATKIARQLGGVTRSAVIGKAHRLGLARTVPAKPGRARSTTKPATRVPVAKAQAHKPKPKSAPAQRAPVASAEPNDAGSPAAPPSPVTPTETGLATVLTLDRHTCRWPIGDPATEAFTICGRHVDGQTYCTEHSRVAFAPAPKGYRKGLMRMANVGRQAWR